MQSLLTPFNPGGSAGPCSPAGLRQRCAVLRLWRERLIIATLACYWAWPAHAIILFGRPGTTENTSAPAGTFTNSGCEHSLFFDFAGTVVGPQHILTAAHLKVSTNAIARFAGLPHRVTGVTNVAGTDLQLLTVDGRFPAWASLYARTNESGRTATLFGRGQPRGNPVFVSTDGTNRLCGWTWAPADGRPRWGTNVVRATFAPGETGLGSPALIACLFDDTAGDDEAGTTGGDSGNGLFVRDRDGVWKLAGVALSVEAQFNTTAEGDGFFGSIFDRRGLFELDETAAWVPTTNTEQQRGAVLLHTRVSTYASALNAWIAQSAGEVKLLSATTPAGPFTEHDSYSVEPFEREIQVTAEAVGRFFQVVGSGSLELLEASPDIVRLTY